LQIGSFRDIDTVISCFSCDCGGAGFNFTSKDKEATPWELKNQFCSFQLSRESPADSKCYTGKMTTLQQLPEEQSMAWNWEMTTGQELGSTVSLLKLKECTAILQIL
jgi:hypothetical protein